MEGIVQPTIMSSSIVLLFLAVVAGLWCTAAALFRSKYGSKAGHRLPPGPRGLPVLGHLHMLGDLPHRSLQNLAKKYGSIMYIRLGLVPTIIVSSPESAELILKTHDLSFAGRPNMEVTRHFSYGGKGLVSAQYGQYWRDMRKLCTLELLSNSKVQLFKPMRREEVVQFINSLKMEAESKSVVDVTTKVNSLIEDITYRMIFGFKDDRFNLRSSFQERVMLAGTFNLADYIPYIGAFDLQGLRRRMKKSCKVIDEFLEEIISEHIRDGNDLRGQHRDFIDVMLSLIDRDDVKEKGLDRDNIKAIMMDIIGAGIDTTATMIDWTIAELLMHPRVLKSVQDELENVVGLDRMVEETDLVRLEYLKMVIKESLRLHPVAPLLVHEAIEDATVDGYFIAKKSRVLVNIWAIGRDNNVWSSNSEDFYPERFVDANIDFQGRDFQLLSFGSGRRKCPGLQVATASFELVLAQMVHCFNWELPHGMIPNHHPDMSEKFGLTLPRASQLLAIPTYRLNT